MPYSAPIPAYFSHSYRATDRLVNEFFVEVLYRAGFTLTVDPKSTVLSPTQLEMMMRDSACFVSVVTRRSEERRYRCSPFAVYEYGLAIQARKPRLLFIEHGVSGHPFMDADRRFIFDRETLSTFTVPEAALLRLVEAGAPYADQARRTLGEVGLVLPSTPDFAEVLPAVEELLEDAGYTPVRLDFAGRDAVAVASRLDRLDYVIAELGGEASASWILPYLMGRFIPSIKLIRRPRDEAEAAALPALVSDRALVRASSTRRPAIWWTDPQDLLGELALEINQLDRPRRRFRDEDDGKAYFRSLGRANGPVFISNSWADNALAGELAQALQHYNIDFFHYQYRNTIPLAVSWQKRLLAKVDESRIFVALISDEYLRSEWCTREMERAEELRRAGRLTMIPYFLDRTSGLNLPVQGAGLELLSTAERVQRIVGDLQQALEQEARLRHRPTAVIAGDHRPIRPDVAVIASSAEHYRAIRSRLDDPQPVIGTQEYPDRFSWSTGTIGSERKGRYRVVVALSEEPTGEAIRATSTAFEPGSVVLLGPAHDVGARGSRADVIVADNLFIFDYQNGHPMARPGGTVLTDPAVVAAARALDQSNRAVVVGPAACGSAGGEVDDQLGTRLRELWPELAVIDPSCAAAVRTLDGLRDTRRLVDFSAVWTVGGEDRDGVSSAASGAEIVAQIIANAWPRPPVTDEPERNDARVGARTP